MKPNGFPDWYDENQTTDPYQLMGMYQQMAESGPAATDELGYGGELDRFASVARMANPVRNFQLAVNTPAAGAQALANLTNLRRAQQEGFGANVAGAREVLGSHWRDPGSVNLETYFSEVNVPYAETASLLAAPFEPGIGAGEINLIQRGVEAAKTAGAAVFAGGKTLMDVLRRNADEAGSLGRPKHMFRTLEDEEVYRAAQAAKPEGARVFSEPVPYAIRLAEDYKLSMPDLDYDPTAYRPGIITRLDAEHQKKIADAFEEALDAPTDPQVRAAYEAMAQETLDQYEHILREGVQFEIWAKGGEPYPNSAAMLRDVRDNKHMYVLATESEFGNEGLTDKVRALNPLMMPSGFTDVNGRPMLINDVFRGVHDFFGHSVRGNSFGAIGEENAWAEHALMYSSLARRAMTTETRGQNSWVNFGPGMRDADGNILKPGDPGYLSARERPFAEQKVTLLPEWVSNPLLGEDVHGAP